MLESCCNFLESASTQCTEVRFASFLSGGFFTASKLAKYTFVQWGAHPSFFINPQVVRGAHPSLFVNPKVFKGCPLDPYFSTTYTCATVTALISDNNRNDNK
jgi:hypothetical protein